ncbi:LysR family transcriptional regulator [Amycolatopsis regifaucium]|uniref:LysR family transcriptional regulator n=1 Tax=Amycolatopsis regifaucium TaxID=546365 RepID=A0A154MXN3_9PSEU|nr:LysR family transcriptional regulator [Amycolatopsis regifaucium]KZB88713.1 LysR family transcriptional regulator [Amycolatopsis regifaucium]OKA07115.1 LysR family transcriptional regulator [Amycolatopsis regifaucium]SFI57969.1 DNA-binding transcriptional regulator, LysR family [Amycolatopsis regifaucium]
MDLRLLRYFVAVIEERHFGRAAARLHMTQPPLSRAIQRLESDLGAVLLLRSAAGVEPTAAGTILYAEARTLLDRAERARARVTAAAGPATLTVGTLSDGAGEAGSRLAEAFRRRHPEVSIRFREADFTDPTTGLRAGLADVALTRSPFDETGFSLRVLRSDPVGIILRTGDPLADRTSLRLADVADRPWFQLPDGTDPLWRAYWNGAAPVGERLPGPVVRTVSECVQAVLWNGTAGIAPLGHPLPDGLTWVPLADMPPSPLVVAWVTGRESPLVRSFARIAVESHR